ncbi:hypothetical protein ONZ45_g3211 [Pleurotus djamor]|nr:hypothetical protein ONZ45_g3211 [Pleurotus djamor]
MADSYDCTSFSGSDYDSDSSRSVGYSSDEGDYSSSSGSSMSSVLTTPHSKKTASVTSKILTNLTPAINRDLEGYSIFNVDFDTFIAAVYGLSEADFQYIEGKTWTLHAAHLLAFEEASSELDMYSPLKALFDNFYKIILVKYPLIDIEVLVFGSTQLKAVHSGTRRKPDGLFVPKNIPNPKKPTWQFCKAYIEVEASRGKKLATVAEPAPAEKKVMSFGGIKASKVKAGSSRWPQSHTARRGKSTLSRSKTSKTIQSAAGTSAPIAEHPDDNDNVSPLLPSTTALVSNEASGQPGPSTRTSGKRHRDFEEEAPRKRHQGVKKETQGASYALECLSANSRRWTTGILVRGRRITIQYFDRCGKITSTAFDFKAEPKKLALLLLGIGKASLPELGFEPFIVPSGATSIQRPLPTPKDADLLIPPPPKRNDDVAGKLNLYEGSTVPDEKTWSRFVISGEPLYVYCGLNGRGTIVFPGRFEKNEQEEGTEDEQQEGKKSAQKGKEKASDDADDIAKLSWPDAGRQQLESDILEVLHEKIPFMRDHLPEVVTSVSFTAALAGLPRAYLIERAAAESKAMYSMGLRHFTIMVSRRYEHLWELKSLEEFKTVFVDIVECHHYAYKLGFILHRDLSEQNLMFTRRSGKARGLVNDWDLSSKFNVRTASDTSRTGTGPFMAIDLLSDDYDNGHMYHHDLESLFYILVWAAVHYDLGSDDPRASEIEPLLQPWTGCFTTAESYKVKFITKINTRDALFEKLRPCFQPLRFTWLEGLWNYFGDAYYEADSRKRASKAEMTTFEGFMEALGVEPRKIPTEYASAPSVDDSNTVA